MNGMKYMVPPDPEVGSLIRLIPPKEYRYLESFVFLVREDGELEVCTHNRFRIGGYTVWYERCNELRYGTAARPIRFVANELTGVRYQFNLSMVEWEAINAE